MLARPGSPASTLHGVTNGWPSLPCVFPAQDIKNPLRTVEGSLESSDQRPRRGTERTHGGAAWELVGPCMADPKLTPESEKGLQPGPESFVSFSSCAGRI